MKLLDKILNTRNTENKSSNIITEYYLNLIDNSPAEISLIEMRDGPNRFNICHVNKHKCENFGLNPDEIIGKKCFEIFEPYRNKNKKENDGHCKDCPSLQAYYVENSVIHKDWEYIQPRRKEIRYASITAKRIPDTTMVVEICRDSTIRKRVYDLTIELGDARSIDKIKEIIFNGFIKQMYFERCSYYNYIEDSEIFILDSSMRVNIGKNSMDREIINLPIPKFNRKKNNSIPDLYLLNEKNPKPILYYISEYVKNGPPQSEYIRPLPLKECPDCDFFERHIFPFWIVLPIISSRKIIGKISLDLRPNYLQILPNNLDDYEIELLGIFARSIGQAIENTNLVNIEQFNEINELVLKVKENDYDDVIYKILLHGCKSLRNNNCAIILYDASKKCVNIYRKEIDGFKTLPIEYSIFSEIYNNQKGTKLPLIIDSIKYGMYQKYKDIGGIFSKNSKQIKSCLLFPIVDSDSNLLGTWYIENTENTLFEKYIIDRIQILCHSTSIAIKIIEQLFQYKMEKIKAEKNLIEKEEFYEAVEHEMIAPIGPIINSFELIKNNLVDLKIESKDFFRFIDDGISNAEFLKYTFDNVDYYRSDNFALNKEYIQLFHDVIRPIIKTTRDFAKSKYINIEYINPENIAERMLLDKNRMKNVFFNLIRNAIRYSYKYTNIKIIGVNTSNGKSIIDIQNNGIEIPNEQKDLIFKKYFRTDIAKKYCSSGMGIGLYIVKKIIDAHGGEIYVESNNNPTIFRLIIPNKKH